MNALRTWAFRLVFYAGSVPIVGTAPISALFGRRAAIDHALAWFTWHRWCTRWIMGIRVRVEGTWPSYPVLYCGQP